MARVNVETRALAEQRFIDLTEELGEGRNWAIGLLVIFWHDSQERGIWSGTREEIQKLIPVNKMSRMAIFDLLLEHEYISELDSNDNQFVIRGNKKHIDALEERKEAAAEGGRAKARNINKNKERLALGSGSLAPAKSALPNSIQFNSIQSNTIHKDISKKPAARKRAEFDLESLYKKYPRKIGKQQGFKKADKDVTCQTTYEALEKAIDHFAEFHRDKGTEEQYIPHFSTFMTSWRDWLDPETGTATVSAGGIDWSKIKLGEKT